MQIQPFSAGYGVHSAAGADSISLQPPTEAVSPTVEVELSQGETSEEGNCGASCDDSKEKAKLAQQEELKREQRLVELKENRRIQQVVNQLSKRDQEVKAHEQAHAAVGGQHAGAPSYEYTKGPDGKQYAVSGEVSIDTSPVAGDPQATLEKAMVIQRAALAPAEPSTQDKRVAAAAQKMASEARVQIVIERREEQEQKAEKAEQTQPVLHGQDDEDETETQVNQADGKKDTKSALASTVSTEEPSGLIK